MGVWQRLGDSHAGALSPFSLLVPTHRELGGAQGPGPSLRGCEAQGEDGVSWVGGRAGTGAYLKPPRALTCPGEAGWLL